MMIVQVAGRTISKYSVVLLVIVLTGLFLRVYDLGVQSIWLDEAFSVALAKMSLSQIVRPGTDTNPPLYHFILHYWTSMFGTSEVAVRLLSALFGVLAIPMIYVVGRKLFNKETGLVGALILALSPLHIQYSQEARMYSLMVLLALLSMYFFILFLQKNSVAISVGYVLSTTLLLYTHTYGVFVVIAQNVYLLTLLFLSREHAFRLKCWIKLQALLVVFFALWISVLISHPSLVQRVSWIQAPGINNLTQTLTTYAGTTNLYYLFLALSVLSLFTYRKVHGSFDWKSPIKAVNAYSWNVRINNVASVLLLTVWLFALNVIPFVVSQVTQPIYFTRYTIAASVAFYLLVAGGIRNINGNYTRLAVIAVIIILSGANLQSYYMSNAKGQGREATSLIDVSADIGDVVLVFPDYTQWIFAYYNNRTDVVVKQIPAWVLSDSENKTSEMIHFNVAGHNRVLLFASPGTKTDKTQEDFILNILNESYAQTYVKSYYASPFGAPLGRLNNYDVYLYEKRA